MAIHLGSAGDGDDEDCMMAAINTTPLVDVMLVLLIIFLITIPVVTHTVPVQLPKEANQPTITQPGNVTIAVDRTGGVWWNEDGLADRAALSARLDGAAAKLPQPEILIRGDKDVAYEHVGRVLAEAQKAGITKVSFITEPPPR
ncbi:Biopolymer transport protein ExbD/TolR [Paramagnetospirillum magnetotacticum MS-1]|uniref:Biopolymer transport protein ExbD/TolR n=1 Tax=Paramagnetospirillum magnetotacticum MS-1 TaxID=272627 RepID=A0A0C2YX94_PARME|nr:biopolymer transporter ExbD [Paramagnetospirillum magnetotacticum]KIL99310.1 Biopolymer transport protein ExbD/TolR [Paramagnetospirillum magnetotacticum MS-1]